MIAWPDHLQVIPIACCHCLRCSNSWHYICNEMQNNSV